MFIIVGLVRAVEEGVASTPASTWGPLLGVVVGAILGGASQVVAGRIQRRDERERETREIKRAVYSTFLRAFNSYHAKLMETEAVLTSRKSRDEAPDDLGDALIALNAAYFDVQIEGSSRVREIARRMWQTSARFLKAIEAGDTDTHHFDHDLGEFQKLLISAARRDLRVSED
jgi:hypothetical protein